MVPFRCQQWEAASEPILRTEKSKQHLLPNCAHDIASLEKLVLDSCDCRLHLFFANDPWSWLWFWSYESSKADTQICYTDREINTKKKKKTQNNLGLYEPATTRWITSCNISWKIMGFKTQHKSSVTGWLFVMFSGGGITAASIKATWWLGHRLISDIIMISGPQEVKCRGGKQVCNYSRLAQKLLKILIKSGMMWGFNIQRCKVILCSWHGKHDFHMWPSMRSTTNHNAKQTDLHLLLTALCWSPWHKMIPSIFFLTY